MADEVEHILPKSLYPELVFDWNNYVFACGPCNGPKGSHFAVHLNVDGRCRNVTRRRNAEISPPLEGTPLLINPRRENPLDFLFLDLSGTFRILPRSGLTFRDRQRARYTIFLLKLNARDPLVESRKNACKNYLYRLRGYVADRDDGKDVTAYSEEFKAMDHRSVWLEMMRQRLDHPKLAALFEAAPEALAW